MNITGKSPELNLDRMRQGYEGYGDFYEWTMNAIDNASDQDTITWVVHDGKRICAIVPVDVAEHHLGCMGEVAERIPPQVPAFFRSARYITLLWRRCAQDYAAGLITMTEKNEARAKILAAAAGLPEAELEKLSGPIRAALAGQYQAGLTGTHDPDRGAEPGR